MTTRIEVPPEPKVKRALTRKSPNRLVVIVLAVAALGLATVLTFTATGDRNAREEATSQAVTLAEEIQRACNSGDIPPEYRSACASAGDVKQNVQAINGTDGTDGTNGRDGVDGVDGLPGRDGRDGLPGTNGTNGVDGSPGGNGTNGVDGSPGLNGVNGNPGADGQPPLGWRTTRWDGSVAECSRVSDFNPSAPRYSCVDISPPTTEPETSIPLGGN